MVHREFGDYLLEPEKDEECQGEEYDGDRITGIEHVQCRLGFLKSQ